MAAYTTIDNPTEFFNTVLYTGNGTAIGSGGNAITGVGFQPDHVWLKCRSITHDYFMFNAVTGVKRFLSSNDTGGLASADNEYLSVFGSDGFTLGNSDGMNENGGSFVSWNWKANGAGASNTDGSINTTKTSANTTSGCSIITYTGNATSGATIGHGMGIKPSMVMVKELAGGNDWIVYTKALTATSILYLNTTGVENDNAVFFNDVEPTTSLVTLGSISATNGNGAAMAAFCFSDVQGFSKQGGYLGNGSTNGVFNYTGFRPAWVLIKNTDATEAWFLYDNRRGVNGAMVALFPDEEAADGGAADNIDLLSNGFKLRSSGAILNASGAEYIYMAFAESPFVTSTGVPTTAR